MASDNFKDGAKKGLPLLIASIVCGWANTVIPSIFPEGEWRDWAFRSLPCLSMILLFVIKSICDFGSMSLSSIMYTICSTSEKKTLRKILRDEFADEETKTKARESYNAIIKGEMEHSAKPRNYISRWPVMKKFLSAKTPTD